jgi:hypothetical protein
VREIQKRHIVDGLLEDRALFRSMSENKEEDVLDLDAAKKYYAKLNQLRPVKLRATGGHHGT